MINWELCKEPLSKEVVSTRKQANISLSYVEGHYVIRKANEIFGFNGWARETLETHLVQTEQKGEKNNWYVGYVARVQVTVGGLIRHGTGFGQGIDADLGKAHESAIKEAETDGMKRALMTFGDPFGLALYDKTQSHIAKEPQQPKPRQGEDDLSAPFGFRLTLVDGAWQEKPPTDNQRKMFYNECANLGIGADYRASWLMFIAGAYGYKDVNKGSSFGAAITFMKNANEDSKISAVNGFQDYVNSGMKEVSNA